MRDGAPSIDRGPDPAQDAVARLLARAHSMPSRHSCRKLFGLGRGASRSCTQFPSTGSARPMDRHGVQRSKVLAAWNALMIRGMAVAGRVLASPAYIESATRALDFVA